MLPLRPWHRGVAADAVIAAAYVAGGELGLGLALVDGQVTPFWPPTAVAVVALFLSRGRRWRGVAAGALIVNATLGTPWLALLAITAGNTLAPLVAARALRAVDFRPQMSRLRDAVALVALAGLGAMLISATVGAASLVLFGDIDPDQFRTVWWVWWTGDAIGVLVFAPLILVARRLWLERSLTLATSVELGLVAVLMLAISRLVLGTDLQLLAPVFPLIIFGALRFGQVGAAPAVVISTVTAAWHAAHSQGVFAGLDLTHRMMLLQALNGCVAATGYLLAASTEERQAAQRQLRLAGSELEARVAARTAELTQLVARLEESEHRAEEAQRLAHVGSWEWDIATGQVTWSNELFRLFGLEPRATGLTYEEYLAALHPEDRDRVNERVQRAYADHQPFAIDHRVVHPDGSEHWVHGRGEVLVDATGTPVRMNGSAQDIDERRAIEAAASRLHDVELRRRQALELNDEIVQGLSVAQYALALGQIEMACESLAGTLEAARQKVSELWDEGAGDGSRGGRDFVRELPARLAPANPAVPPQRADDATSINVGEASHVH